MTSGAHQKISIEHMGESVKKQRRILGPGNHADELAKLDGNPEAQRRYMAEQVPESMHACVRTCYRYGRIIESKLQAIQATIRRRA